VECSQLARLEGEHHRVVGLLRLLRLRENGGDIWEQIDKLTDHDLERKEDAENRMMIQHEVIIPVKDITETDVDDEELHRLVGIIETNSIAFTNARDGVMGRALYPTLSLANHSCIANTRFAVNPEDFSVVLRAKRKIAEGEEITINYSHPIYGVPKRKHQLLSRWMFDCRCPRCLDVTEFGTNISALKCSHCREGLILPDSIESDSLWRCRFCSNPFEPEFICGLLKRIEDELYDILETNPTVKSLESFIKDNSNDLHTKHYLNLIAQRNIIKLLTKNTNMTREVAKKVIRLGKSFKTTMSALDVGYSEWLGFILKKTNTAQLELLKLDLKEKKINKNAFAEESETVWKSMKEVEKCDILCAYVKYPKKI